VTKESTRVGFIGLGDIGLPMAKRIASQGYQVTVCGHVRREPVEEMKSLGASEVVTPREVAEASEVTITMLRDDKDTGKVVLGPGGVMEAAQEGFTIILMSTLSPAFCREVGAIGKAKGVGVLDAPVTGTRVRAATGELGIMVGGGKELVDKYRALLQTMGTVIYCGDLGMGEIVKLVNNMAGIVHSLVDAEAISWGIRNGADEQLLVELMKIGTGNSWVIEHWDFVKTMWTDPPPVTYYLGAKDLTYALEIGLEIGQPCPFAGLACELLKAPPPQIPKPQG